ncbi:Guanine nucleotide exchange C9orf72 [Lamellibrachia satsuma]|nr:Guanine nucleotide exchange C9orf72 [Lamellibrachia satsuma]
MPNGGSYGGFPISPSSMFGKTCLACDSDCVINTIVLSYWDNILGPKIKHIWTMGRECDTNVDVLTHVATHTLSGEIYQYGLDAELNTKFYTVARHNITVAAFVFSAMEKGDMTVHSMSLVLPHHRCDVFLCWHGLCRAWMMRLIGKMRVLLAKETDNTAVRLFSVDLSEFVRMISSLTSLAVPKHIPLSITAMHREHKFDVSLLRQAITSHLSTCGRSVVIGRSVDQINLMVSSLAMFVSPEERRCCRYVSCDNPLPYHPDVCVQGILQEKQKEAGACCVFSILGELWVEDLCGFLTSCG